MSTWTEKGAGMTANDCYTAGDRQGFRAWVATRPANVQEAFRAYPPGLYQKLDAAYTQHVRLRAISENDDGECTMCIISIFQDDNPGVPLAFERSVFDVPLNVLKPLDVWAWWED